MSRYVPPRLITPSQLALFSRSPVIGAWWEELHVIDSKRAPRPKVKALDELLRDAGLEHEKVLIGQLNRDDKRVAELRGKQDALDYEEALEAMAHGLALEQRVQLHSTHQQPQVRHPGPERLRKSHTNRG